MIWSDRTERTRVHLRRSTRHIVYTHDGLRALGLRDLHNNAARDKPVTVAPRHVYNGICKYYPNAFVTFLLYVTLWGGEGRACLTPFLYCYYVFSVVLGATTENDRLVSNACVTRGLGRVWWYTVWITPRVVHPPKSRLKPIWPCLITTVLRQKCRPVTEGGEEVKM